MSISRVWGWVRRKPTPATLILRSVTRVNDTEVLAGLRAGDPRALRSAYERHKQDVLAVAVAVLGRVGASEAWDVLHDVFVGLAKNAQSLRPAAAQRGGRLVAVLQHPRGRIRAIRQTECP